MTSSFEFKESNTTTYECIIDVNIVLHIYQINRSNALISFTDTSNKKINIPKGIVVYEYDFQTKEKVVLKPIREEYVLCWTDDYTIERNGKTLLDIKNERKWKIIK